MIIKPLVDALFVCLKTSKPKVPEKRKLRDAYTFILNYEKYLKVFLTDGDVPMDNNANERTIRSFCIGKKYLEMIDTINEANISAILNIISKIAKANT